MKCPHCNQEHPEGTRYCPMTGNEILPQLQSCPKSTCANYGKLVIPANYLYCPLCGSALRGSSSPQPSTGSDIAYNGVILGQTTLQDLRNRSVEVRYEQGGYFALLNEEHEIFASIFRLKPDELNKFIKRYKKPNKDFFLNREKIVNMMMFMSLNHCPILNDIYINANSDKDEIVNILEENGWMRIESQFKDDDEENNYSFVRTLPDSVGNRIFLTVAEEGVGACFSANCMKEWKSYDTGEVYKL